MKTTKRPARARAAGWAVGALVVFALICDLGRTSWRHFQAHPVQAASWLIGAVVLVAVVWFIVSLDIHD